MYIEASYDAKLKANDTARLATRQTVQFSKGYCIQWYYYMYGSDVSTLSVYVASATDKGKISQQS